MPSLQSLQFATFQQQQHPSSRTKLMMTNGSHSHILTPTQHTHTHAHALFLSLSLSHSLPSDAHKLNLTLTHSCSRMALTWYLPRKHSPTDGMSFSQFGNRQARIFFQTFVLMKNDFVLKDTNKQWPQQGGFYSSEVAYFILTLRPQVRFSAFPRIFLLMLLRTVNRVLDIGKLVLEKNDHTRSQFWMASKFKL